MRPLFGAALYTARPYSAQLEQGQHQKKALDGIQQDLPSNIQFSTINTEALGQAPSEDAFARYSEFQGLSAGEDKAKIKQAANRLIDAGLPVIYLPWDQLAGSRVLNTLKQTNFLKNEIPTPAPSTSAVKPKPAPESLWQRYSKKL
jgi:hypothetical protein